MATVIINVPIQVECDIKSYSSSDESIFQLDKTDFIEITNIKAPDKITVAASSIIIVN
jgi:hypothetical protein